MSAIDEMADAFGAYESAIDDAQRAHHNYQEWSGEQWWPIDAARSVRRGIPAREGTLR
jgi:hypothetical protein